MDPKKILVLIKRDGEWLDRTSQILSLKKEGALFKVMFFGKPIYYSYNLQGIIIDERPKSITCLAIKTDERVIRSFEEVLYFPKTRVIKVFTKDYAYTFFKGEYEIIEDSLSTVKEACGVFNYYKEIANLMCEKNSDLFGYLKKEYDDIVAVPSDSALSAYLTGKNKKYPLGETLLFPFSFNGSQHQALTNAFTNDVSIVEGPPGTGKTQTILNLLATAISNNLTVAVVSNNNSAISNVKEKLEANGFGSIVAMLGNVENIENFFDNKPALNVPKIEKDYTTVFRYNSFVQAKIKIDKNKELMNKEIEQLKYLKEEYERFKEETTLNEKLSRYTKRVESGLANEAIAVLETRHRKLGFFRRLAFSLKYKLPAKILKNSDLEEIISFYRNAYYKNKISELESELEEITKAIENSEKLKLEEKIRKYSLWRFFKSSFAFLGDKADTLDRRNYKQNFKQFLDRYPVFLSSTYSLARCVPMNFTFDLLIVDESSQVNIISILPALAKAKKVVFLGDLKQLPEIDDSELAADDETLRERFEVPSSYASSDNSVLKSVKAVFGKNAPSVLLNEHYRCQLDIINFSSRRFYNNELVCFTKDDGKKEHLRIVKTVPGNHARKNPDGSGQYNEREIAEILKLIKEIPSTETVSVITPYRYQASLLQSQVPSNVTVDTIHRFQGRESDVVIFSTVTNSADDYVLDKETIKNFVNQDELINVALTRAKHRFVLVTSDKIYNESKGCLGDLVKYLRFETKCVTSEGTVKSIFDILYRDYEEVRKKYLAAHKSNDVITEILVKEKIEEILASNEKFSSFEVMEHVRLSDMIRFDDSKYSAEELKYLRHPWTHVDFVIMNKYDKKPVKLIEVDGIGYHEQSSKQSAHDEIKDRAAKLNGFEILRLKTNGSNEEKIITNALLEVA